MNQNNVEYTIDRTFIVQLFISKLYFSKAEIISD